MGRHQKGGFVTEQAFIEYYADVNATLPAEKDDYFVDTVLKTWGLSTSKVFVAPTRVDEIESIVFEKIRQRTHGTDDEGKTVKKIFKHFDLNGFGTIEPSEFKKALETLGCTFKDIELEHLFRRYDINNNGKLDYEEFAAAFARRGSGNSPNVNPVFGITREPPNTVLDKILVVLKQRGTYGIRGLGRVFRRMDNSNNGKLDRQEFTWGLKENGHVLSPSEFERLFKYFDKNNDGVLNYNEFLSGLRGNLNARRRAVVQRAFKKFDKSGNGVVDLEDLAGVYDVSQHPRLRSGAKTKDELLNEWLSQWDTIKADGKVSLAEFEEFYKDVSASIDDDEYFEFVITAAWKL
jgi:Ca2+-binding EF-hand superfamily protein